LPNSKTKTDAYRAEAQGFSPAKSSHAEGVTALPEAGVQPQAERPDLSPLLLPLFSAQSATSKLFFALLLSKIACQALKPIIKPLTHAPSTR
jgi:hypothetical protein